MTSAELDAVLQRLNDADPTSRISRKRQLLSSAREPLVALHRRGYSWRSLARELSSATGESISADLLRAACLQRRKRGPVPGAKDKSEQQKLRSTTVGVAAATSIPKADAQPSDGRFGAKGLKL